MVSETATVDDADALSFNSKRELSIRDNDEYFDWTVRVEVDKFALRCRTFSVLIFLGKELSSKQRTFAWFQLGIFSCYLW